MKARNLTAVEPRTLGLLGTCCLVLATVAGCGQPSTAPRAATRTSKPQPIVQIGHAYALIGHAFSPDGSRLFTADPQCVMVWDANTGVKLAVRPWANQPPAKHSRASSSMFHFVNDGRQVVIGAELWDVASGQPLGHCYLLNNASRWVTIAPDGKASGNLEYVK